MIFKVDLNDGNGYKDIEIEGEPWLYDVEVATEMALKTSSFNPGYLGAAFVICPDNQEFEVRFWVEDTNRFSINIPFATTYRSN